MKCEMKIQKDGVNTLKSEMLSHSNKSLKKTYIMVGDMKESGYDVIEEFLIDLKAKKHIVFGVDKKNTTRKLLENILKYTKTVYVWDNNKDIEFNANIFVFEYDDYAKIYSFAGELTDSMLETDICMYTVVTFDLVRDKKEYSEFISSLLENTKQEFVKLTKEYIDELAENKSIFTTKQYMHVLPSISELLNKSDNATKAEEKVFDDVKLPKIEVNNLDDTDSFEIDLGDISIYTNENIEEENSGFNELKNTDNDEVETEAFGLNEDVNEIYEQEDISNEVIDLESLILESEVVKLDKAMIDKVDKVEVSKEKTTNKKINLENVSNIIMELAKKPTKGRDINRVKVPNYIKDMIPTFFEIMEDAKLQKNDDGEYKEINIKLEVIDVNTSNKYVDSNASLKQRVGQTFVEFESDRLIDVDYEEMDIARIIKLAKDYYHIEIIPNGIDEYKLWKKLCTNNFRGSNRQYGLM